MSLLINPKNKILIVGGGLIGPFLALILKKKGFQVELFEKRPDIRNIDKAQGRSINLVLTSRGIHALKSVDLWEEVKNITIPIRGRMMHSPEGVLTYQPYGKEGQCNYSISRLELNKELLSHAENAGVKICFDYDLESIDTENMRAIFLSESKRKSISFDVLLGADGSGSRVRKEIVRLTNCNDQTEWLDACYKELLMPADKKGDYVLDKNALHIWPRGQHMMMALANPDGSFTMTLYLPPENEMFGFNNLNSEELIKNYFKTYHSDSIPLMPNYIDDFINNPVGKLGTVRCSDWIYEDKIALVGDAAHGIVPFFGQGANAGLEGCMTLLEAIENSDNWRDAFSHYFKVYKPNGDAIADMAIENYFEMADKVADSKFLYKKSIEQYLGKEFPGKFQSRYGMVVYSLVPYCLIKKIGIIQNEILSNLVVNTDSLDEINLKEVEVEIDQKVTPLLNDYKSSEK